VSNLNETDKRFRTYVEDLTKKLTFNTWGQGLFSLSA
jgi:hypothetical protein